jgi:hypothetical protein
MSGLADVVDKLCRISDKEFVDLHSGLEWPRELDRDQWFMSPELISAAGTRAYAALSPQQQRRLSFFEIVNLFSLTLNGEKYLVQGVAERLYLKDSAGISSYLHHILDEENKHMLYFGGFCMRYAGKVYPDKKLHAASEYAPGEKDFLFFARAMIFEEIVDAVNVELTEDARVHAFVREICRRHHLDESRHLAFGRKYVAELFGELARRWSPEVTARVRAHLGGYWTAVWKEYYNPDAYADAGLAKPFELYEEAFASPKARETRRRISSRGIAFLKDSGVLLEEPAL